jgi:PqqD family protein of HPr-rel-A system
MWRLIPGQTLRFRAWGDEFVLYNDLSGDTHLLGASAVHILQSIQHTTADEDVLIASLCESMQMDRDEEVALHVTQLLADLKSLSLIERAIC